MNPTKEALVIDDPHYHKSWRLDNYATCKVRAANAQNNSVQGTPERPSVSR